MFRSKSIGVTIMTTVDNSKVSQTSGKDQDSKDKGFFNRPRAGGKSFWDWMQLLLIPVILVIVGSYFSYQQTQTSLQVSRQQHQQDQANALDQQQATTLQTYIDNIQDLLLNHNLLGNSPKPKSDADKVAIKEVQELARARTLSAMRQLDGTRNSFLLQFLQDAQLIGFQNDNIVSFEAADLSFTDLRNAHLNDANLRNAHLNNANLNGADLNGADLNGADLSDAHLNGASLSNADLSNAHLIGAHLNGADLSGADLSGANLNGASLSIGTLSDDDLSIATLTQQQLDQVRTCAGAILPQGLICHHNQ
jgi:uncharacterized protein YjbI with pentapeptide repeats